MPVDLTLRPAILDDVDFIVSCEQDSRALPYVVLWTKEQHHSALTNPDCITCIIVDPEDHAPVGFILVCGLQSPHQSVELRRIVCSRPGRGLGRAALRWVKRQAFQEWGAHRLWLDVVVSNDRARQLYLSEGFVEEGVLRDAMKAPGGYLSLTILSILRPEFEKPASE